MTMERQNSGGGGQKRRLDEDPNGPVVFGLKEKKKGQDFGQTGDGMEVMFFQHTGKKAYQEDRLIVYTPFAQEIKGSRFKLLAVFDGHGGHRTSDYLEEHFPNNLLEEIKKEPELLKPPPTELKEKKARQLLAKAAMMRCVDRTEKDVMVLQATNDGLANDGSTAVICLFDGDTVTTLNLGDSRAVLARVQKNGGKVKAIQLSKDHTAGVSDEAKRIRKAGGIVAGGRIFLPKQEKEVTVIVGDAMQTVTVEEQRSIEVSRSFGDPDFKKGSGVISVPNLSKFNMTDRDMFMLLACDGLFEVWQNQQLVDFLYTKLFTDPTQPTMEEVVKQLFKETILHRFAKDNTSVVLLRMKPRDSSTKKPRLK